ncbi:MAG: radical SAM protein, partial [Candidatus Korarchaeum sp.]|nr:radical SAM protein [Candidatus Korarchaeum sp.]MDW8036084.1 radical SAM protein [Candidatus Korarchaeum sp.]
MRVRVRGGFFIPDLQPPKEVHVELTNECNLNCSICYRRSWDAERGYMRTDLFEKLLRELKKLSARSIWFDGFGEPTLHPDFERFVKIAADDFEVNLVTNGTLICDKVERVAGNLSNVFVSIDSVNSGTYYLVRGSDLRRLEKGLRVIVNETRVWLSSVLTKS